MQSLSVNSYTAKQVDSALKSGSRLVKFRYDLLDKNEIFKQKLYTVESGEVEMSSLSQIKRTGKFTIKDDGIINWLTDRIQPYFMLRMPDGGFAQWSLGIFLMSTPKKKDIHNVIYRDVEAYDAIQILLADKFDYRITFAAGYNYITAVKDVLVSAGITKMNLVPTTSTLSVARDWEPGTTKYQVIDDLLKDINYNKLWVDEYGYFTAQPYLTPAQRAADYIYINDSKSIIAPGLEDSQDLFNVPNKWTVVASNPEGTPLSSTYTNSNPSSSTSTVTRGFTTLDFSKINYIANQTTLDAYVARLAFERSQVYNDVEFQTALMPQHSFNDVIQLNYSVHNINDKFQEIGWTLPLKAGQLMRHKVRRVVQV